MVIAVLSLLVTAEEGFANLELFGFTLGTGS